MSETETPEVLEVPQPSKLAKVRNVAITAGIFVIPTAVMVGASALGYKTSCNNLEAAKLTFEAAVLNNKAA